MLRVIRTEIWVYVLAGMVIALLQAFALSLLVDIPFRFLFLDALVFSLIYLIVSVLLLNVLKFGHLEKLFLPVRLFNFMVLGVFTLLFTLALGAGLDWLLFGREMYPGFTSLLPLKALIALLVYALVIAWNLGRPEEDAGEFEMQEDVSGGPEEAVEPELERIAVKTGAKIHVVQIQEVVCLLADGDYVQVVTSQGRFLKEQTMKYFETHLPENMFARVHRSCIVNVEYISRIDLYEKHNQQLMLKNGEKVKVSQNGYKMLRQKLGL